MPIPFLDHLNFTQCEAQNMVIQNLSAAPSSPKKGQTYFDSALNQLGVYDGTQWTYYSAGVTNSVTKAANSAAVNTLQVSGGANKSIIDYTGGAGLVKTTAGGVASAAVAGTDYTTPTGTETLTGKTINATNNTISNLDTTHLKAGVLNTSTTLSGAADTNLPSTLAVKTYVDNKVANGVNMMGVIDASANPNYPAAAKGDYYKISVAGKIGGASGVSVQAGDAIIAVTANAGGTDVSVGASWDIVQANVDQSSTTAIGLVQLATQAEAEAKVVSSKAVTPAALVSFAIRKTFTITGDSATTSFAVTHGLGTKDVDFVVRNSTDQRVNVNAVSTSTTVLTLTFAVAPTTGVTYTVVVFG